MGFTVKDTIQKTFGYIFTIPGILLFFLGIAMFFTSKDASDIEAGAAIAIFAWALIIPGAIFLYKGYRLSKDEELVESLAMIIHANRRITIDDIATKLGISVPQARTLMLRALNLNLVKGFFDRTTGEFFTEEGKKDSLVYKFCPSCGSPFKRVYLEGETIKCDACGMIVH